MEIPYSRWYHAIWRRRSRRLFDSKPIPPDLLEKITALCNDFRPFTGVRAVIITDSPEKVFKGIVGSYGKVKGAPALIAFIGDSNDPHVREKVGYLGEGVILEATALGIGTCWVGVSFRPETVASLSHVGGSEKVLAVTPVGYGAERVSFEERVLTGFGKTHKRKPLDELVTGIEPERWPFWIKTSLDAARLAPSAVNRQPWRFHIDTDAVTISVDDLRDTFDISKRLDCGIAMLHIEVAALYCNVQGKWEFLNSPAVARFKVSR